MITILYFHGYNGENSVKYEILKDYFAKEGVEVVKIIQTYDRRADADRVAKAMAQAKKKDWLGKFFIVGSSLGCVYSMFYSLKLQIPCLLINPAYEVEERLKGRMEPEKLETMLEVLRRIDEMPYIPALFNVFLAEDDELLTFDKFLADFRIFRTIKRFPDKGHGFKNFQENVEEVGYIMDYYFWEGEF